MESDATAGNPKPRPGSPATASSTHAWLLSFSAHVQHEAQLSNVTSAPGSATGVSLGDVLAMETQEGEDRGQWGNRGWDGAVVPVVRMLGEDATSVTAGTPRLTAGREGQSRPRPAGLDRFKPARAGMSRSVKYSASKFPARAAKRFQQVGSVCTSHESMEGIHCWSEGSAVANSGMPSQRRQRASDPASENREREARWLRAFVAKDGVQAQKAYVVTHKSTSTGRHPVPCSTCMHHPAGCWRCTYTINTSLGLFSSSQHSSV